MDTCTSQLSKNFSPELVETILRSGSRRIVSVNSHVFFEGDEAKFLPIVISGRIKMVRFPEPGKEIIIGFFQAGELFAIPPAIDGKRFPATAVSMEDSEVLLLPRERFLELMGSSIEFSSIIMGRMCGILRDRAETVQIMATPSAENRVANVLLLLSGEMNGNETKKITHRRQDIAEKAGLSLESTIRMIRKLAEKGFVKIIRGRIFIETTDHLRDMVR